MASKKKSGAKVAGKKKAAKEREVKPGPDGFLGKWRLFAFKLRQQDRELLDVAAKEQHVETSVFVRTAVFEKLKKLGHTPSGDY